MLIIVGKNREVGSKRPERGSIQTEITSGAIQRFQKQDRKRNRGKIKILRQYGNKMVGLGRSDKMGGGK